MIYVHLANGTEEVEFVTIVDLLRRAGLEVRTVSVMDTLKDKGAHDIYLEADMMFDEADYGECEMIVLPGGLEGTYNFRDHKGLIEKIREFDEAGKLVGAICAAPLVLEHAGILADRKATIYTGMEKHISSAVHADGNVVVDDNIVTSKGPGTAMEFALEIVRLHLGRDKMLALRKQLLLD